MMGIEATVGYKYIDRPKTCDVKVQAQVQPRDIARQLPVKQINTFSGPQVPSAFEAL